ncbi:MAG: hypothetical protein WCA51_09245 [Dehalococcoidia bacterium]
MEEKIFDGFLCSISLMLSYSRASSRRDFKLDVVADNEAQAAHPILGH